jgi:hypothetical protein
MKIIFKIFLFTLLLLITGCVTQFFPETTEDKDILVVEGLITDQPGVNTIKLSTSMPLGNSSSKKPLSGCFVTVSDDLGSAYIFHESSPGTYSSDPAVFQGIIGRSYTLHINSVGTSGNHIYETYPVEMKAVPPIDSLYYDKVVIANPDPWTPLKEGCQIYLNTHDHSNGCQFYRWEFTETWEIHIPYPIPPNKVCWVTDNSDMINIKSTAALEEDRINRYPLDFISNTSDRLRSKYSILVSQYSLNEDEYQYWEKLQNVTEQVGGLYDIIPAAVPSNVSCIDDPTQRVLGYFSVSAKSTRRLFVKDRFSGIVNPYTDDICVSDTVSWRANIPNLNVSVWIIMENPPPASPSYKVLTMIKGCADCTVRGTNIEPDFWNDDK